MKENELVDLVDADGVPRRRHITRAEVARRKAELASAGLFQPIVVVVVIDDGRIIGQIRGRSKGDDDPGAIDHVCGVIASGETWLETARREAAEEIGVELDRVTFVVSGVNVNQRHRTLVAAAPRGQPQRGDASEVEGLVVATPVELRAMATDTKFVPGFFDDLDRALEAFDAP